MNQKMAEARSNIEPAPFWRFSLAELMGCITVAAVGCAFWKVHPAVGFFSAILLISTTLQTMRATRICRRMEIPLDLYEHFLNFAFSMLIVIVAAGCFLVSLFFLFQFGSAIHFILFYITPSIVSTSVTILLTCIVGSIVPVKIMNHFKLRAGLKDYKKSQTPHEAR